MSFLFTEPDVGLRILARCDKLASISEPGPGVTRLYLSDEHKAAIGLVADWMRKAGMEVHVDAAANLIGRYHAASGAGPYLVLGSHLDSVIEGGKFDGPLGVLCAIECVAELHRSDCRLNFGIELIAFGDEEGARFRTDLAGSRAVAGTFDLAMLDAKDKSGISLADAMTAFGLDPAQICSAGHDRKDVLGYVELHIEQGPVLEQENQPVGVVTGICGQTRKLMILRAKPGHAGTVPMRLRHDPFLAGAEIALAAEQIATAHPDAVSTVGQVEVRPGSVNVIPGEATLSFDMRARSDTVRQAMVAQFESEARCIARKRGVEIEIRSLLDVDASPCSGWLVDQIAAAVEDVGFQPLHLPSGAGHDGMAMIALTDIAMLFVRCKDGVSHSPLESVESGDVAVAARTLLRFVKGFKPSRVTMSDSVPL